MLKYTKIMKNSLLIALFTALLVALGGCSEDDKFSGMYFDPTNPDIFSSYFKFYATVDPDLNPSCGTSKLESGTADGGDAVYTITSYYIFETGKSPLTFNYPISSATLFMKYKYTDTRRSYTLSPTTSSSYTCYTTDYIHCDGTTGNPTCTTVDGITCGGEASFIFTSDSPAIVFQAYSGSIDWTDGYSLNTSINEVDLSRLNFDLIDDSGRVFEGKLDCKNSSY